MAKRNRITVGQLVASSNPLRKIFATRLEVQVLYVDTKFSKRIVSEKIVGIAH